MKRFALCVLSLIWLSLIAAPADAQIFRRLRFRRPSPQMQPAKILPARRAELQQAAPEVTGSRILDGNAAVAAVTAVRVDEQGRTTINPKIGNPKMGNAQSGNPKSGQSQPQPPPAVNDPLADERIKIIGSIGTSDGNTIQASGIATPPNSGEPLISP